MRGKMKDNRKYGICDFSEFAEEIPAEAIVFVNGGGSSGCGYSVDYIGVSSSCGGGLSGDTSYCGGGYSGGGSWIYSDNGSCGGAYQRPLPKKQTCALPNDYHCDIYAWNLAVDHGVDPRKGKWVVKDLNAITVDEMYRTYYNGLSAPFDASSAGKKGVIVYDWADNGLGAKDHIEYVEISIDGLSYTLYVTDGKDAPVPETRWFSTSPKARAAGDSAMTFIPLD